MTSNNWRYFRTPIVKLFSVGLMYFRHKTLLLKTVTSFMDDPLSFTCIMVMQFSALLKIFLFSVKILIFEMFICNINLFYYHY